MTEAVNEFRVLLTGLYRHNGGYVRLMKDPEPSNEDTLLKWDEGASGGYVSGQAVIDYCPEEDLDDCDDEDCAAHSDDNESLCEACEVKCRDICLDNLLRDY